LLSALVPDAAYLSSLQPGTTLLDIGAGNGNIVTGLRRAGIDAWGVEPSREAVALAKSRGTDEIVVGTLESALESGDLPAQEWGVARLYQVLEHLDNPLRTLSHVHSILAPDGRLIVGVPNFDALARRVLGPSWDGLELPRHLTHFTRRSLLALLERARFRVTSLHTVALFGVLPGSLDAASTGGRRQRGWGESLLLRVICYPVELACAGLGLGDGLIAEAIPV